MSGENPLTAVHAIFQGRVQGVGFRAFVLGLGRKSGLSGWVRNMPDGTVEALFAGDDAVVSLMLESCRRAPFPIRVDNMYTFPAQMPLAEGFHVVA